MQGTQESVPLSNLSTGTQNLSSSNAPRLLDELGRPRHAANEARTAKDKIEQAMNLKQLQSNANKASFLSIGTGKRVHSTKSEDKNGVKEPKTEKAKLKAAKPGQGGHE